MDLPPQTYTRPTASAPFPVSIAHCSLYYTNGQINNSHGGRQQRKISQRLKVILVCDEPSWLDYEYKPKLAAFLIGRR